MGTCRTVMAFITWCTLTAGSLAARPTLPAGPLAQYVAKPDPTYSWRKVHEGKIDTSSYAEIILTSQTWRGIEWKHQLFLIKPSNVDPAARQAVLVIGGGRWHDELNNPGQRTKLPGEASLFELLAEQIRSPVAVISQVPFQPLFDGKVEDAIISLTFENFLKTGDPEWPLLLPMVKSAVRAMDTAQTFCRDEWSIPIDGFTVTGGSKRGWTTWLTGAVDPRATAIAPMVIDVLNMNKQMKHQLDSWGSYSEQIEDYTQRGLQEHMASEKGRSLLEIVDPYSYRTALNQPKLIMIGTNDRYWPLDALNLYWDDLSGQNFILYVPNNGHGLRDFPRIIGGLKALHEQASGKKTLPNLTWHYQPNGKHLQLKVQSDVTPSKVQVWLASSESRDFRESIWKSEPAEPNGDSYDYQLDAPQSGYAAIFAEAVYPNDGLQYFLSTNVRIVSAAGGAEGAGGSGSAGSSDSQIQGDAP